MPKDVKNEANEKLEEITKQYEELHQEYENLKIE